MPLKKVSGLTRARVDQLASVRFDVRFRDVLHVGCCRGVRVLMVFVETSEEIHFGWVFEFGGSVETWRSLFEDFCVEHHAMGNGWKNAGNQKMGENESKKSNFF